MLKENDDSNRDCLYLDIFEMIYIDNGGNRWVLVGMFMNFF